MELGLVIGLHLAEERDDKQAGCQVEGGRHQVHGGGGGAAKMVLCWI